MRTEPDIFQPNTSQVTEQCSGGSASPANAHAEAHQWVALPEESSSSRLSVLMAAGDACPCLSQHHAWSSELADTTDTGWACAANWGTGSMHIGFDPAELLVRKVGRAEVKESKQGREVPLIATAPQALLMSATSHSRAGTQKDSKQRSFKLDFGVNYISLSPHWSPRHQNPYTKWHKAKTKPSPRF